MARPYKVPDNRKRADRRRLLRRRRPPPARAGAASSGNGGLLAAAVFLAAGRRLPLGHRLAARSSTRPAALAASAAAAGFPVGHASAQLAWRGFRSRPVWRVLLYSADEPPSKRGLVELDAVDGEILGSYTEDNPEDWSAYGFSSGGSPPASAS